MLKLLRSDCLDCELAWAPWSDCLDGSRVRLQYVVQEPVGAGAKCPVDLGTEMEGIGVYCFFKPVCA